MIMKNMPYLKSGGVAKSIVDFREGSRAFPFLIIPSKIGTSCLNLIKISVSIQLFKRSYVINGKGVSATSIINILTAVKSPQIIHGCVSCLQLGRILKSVSIGPTLCPCARLSHSKHLCFVSLINHGRSKVICHASSHRSF